MQKLRMPVGPHEMRWWYNAFQSFLAMGFKRSQADSLANVALMYRLEINRG